MASPPSPAANKFQLNIIAESKGIDIAPLFEISREVLPDTLVRGCVWVSVHAKTTPS